MLGGKQSGGGLAMSIRYHPDGTFEFDTVEEAVRWHETVNARKSLKTAGAGEKNGTEDETKNRERQDGAANTKREIAAFVAALNTNGRNLLAALAEAHPSWLSSSALATKVGVDPSAIGPVLRHVYVNAKQHGFDRSEIVVRDDKGGQGQPRSSFKLADAAAVALKKVLVG
jgi:hypothetical protein